MYILPRHADIVFVGYALRKSMVDAISWMNRNFGLDIGFQYFNVYDVEYERVSTKDYCDALKRADVVLLDIRGGDNIYKLTIESVKKSSARVVVSLVGGSGELIELTRLGKFSPKVFRSGRFKSFFKKDHIDYGTIVRIRDMFEKLGSLIPIGLLRDAKNYVYILKYYEYPVFENMKNMLALILKEYLGLNIDYRINEPLSLPPMGIYDFHTNRVYTSTRDYLENYPYRDKPLIGILFYGGHHFDQSIVAAEKIAWEIEARGYGVIPVFSGDLRYYLAIHKYFILDDKPIVNALIDLLWFRFAGGPLGGDHKKTYAVLKLLNTPVLHGIHLSSTIDEWLEKNSILPIEIITTVILPELDGRIEPTVTHGRKQIMYGEHVVDEYVAIDDRVEKIACRACKWVSLKQKENRDKRVAIIIYSYPPGIENLGKASYLDVFASLEKILHALRNENYDLPYVPDKEELREKLLKTYIEAQEKKTSHGNGICIDSKTYEQLLSDLPEQLSKDVISFWGSPPEKICIPGLVLGNVFIGIQPSRGKHEDPTKIYHSRNIPPTHQYIAFYKWIEKIFGADAVIHLGTHGTLEFLPGKEVGLTQSCVPDALIGCLPNIYVYHVINPSEASIAKRRSYALIISHAPPPYTKYDPPEEIVFLERKISQYYEAKQFSEKRAKDILREIIVEAQKLGLGNNIDEIHDRLEEYKRSILPKGLHVLGEKPSPREVLDYLVFLSRRDLGETPGLHRLVAEAEGFNYEELLTGKKSKLLQYIEDKVERLLRLILIEGHSVRKAVKLLDLKNIDTSRLSKTVSYLRSILENIESSDEIESILKALNGEYIMPSPGGDPLRTPEVYPTGRNMYQLDPYNIPTTTAWRRGVEAAEALLKKYYMEHGKYPRTISVVLWAFETMKTGGETLAMIFWLLGVKPVWKTPYVRDLEIIPLEKLGRPRIDLLVTICGIFRDTFYNIVELLDKAFRIVANLDEPLDKNYVKANNEEIRKRHGIIHAPRIYGPPPDKYATELTTLIETSSWKTEEELVRAYYESMRYAYGVNIHGKEMGEVLSSLAVNSDVVVQVRDSVEYEVTDLDHYYEFLGGLSRFIESRRGNRPLILVADSTRETIHVENISESIRRGVITRILNPKWLEEMLKHKHHGGEKIATRVENLLGLAATTHSVENWVWSNIAEKLVFNEEIRHKILDNNPWAMKKMIEKLIEAHTRGYWKTDRKTIDRLRRILDETNRHIEDTITTLMK